MGVAATLPEFSEWTLLQLSFLGKFDFRFLHKNEC